MPTPLPRLVKAVRRRRQGAPANGVTLFLSPGRCGTQWLASILSNLYGDIASVTHEPIGARYQPRNFLRKYEETRQMAQIEEVADHLAWVDGELATRQYIETGWPSYAAIPLFLARYPGRVKLVQLVRHPVPTAVSAMTFDLFNRERRADDEYTKLGVVDPTCDGVAQQDYRARWPSMSEYERCLFWWTEIQLYAEEISTRYPDVPFLRLRSEEMFDPALGGLRRLVSFLGLPERPGLSESTEERVDLWRFKGDVAFDWRQINTHPRTLSLMEKYGYSLADISDDELTTSFQSRSAVPTWKPNDSQS